MIKTLSQKAAAVIDQYLNFKLGQATCAIPYYNNRHIKARARLRAQIGKGSPKEIFDEAESLAIFEKIEVNKLDSSSLKKFLVDQNIGIDCSGLVYHILEAESESRNKGKLSKHLFSPKGIMNKIMTSLRSIENTDVVRFADNNNSKIVAIKDVEPGDFITMVGGQEVKERNHIIVIHKIEDQTLHYTHTVAWPTDGEYGHGVRQGSIHIIDPDKSILEQRWQEAGKMNDENYTFTRALKSQTELRRLNWL